MPNSPTTASEALSAGVAGQRAGIAVVIPAYRVTRHIEDVVSRVGGEVDAIYIVDDTCPDGSGDYAEANISDPRVRVLRNPKNLGVGGAVLNGLAQAYSDGFLIGVKIDGDGQMDPAILYRFVDPILGGRADYTKGNRFFDPRSLHKMPRGRLFGNALLSFAAKFSTGYWNLFDPTNGYVALDLRLLPYLSPERVARRYFFETDLLFRANLVRARVLDIPMRAVYEDETSHLSAFREGPKFLAGHARNFFKRLAYSYFIRDFSLASVELVVGTLCILFGIGVAVPSLLTPEPESAGTVMLASLPIFTGILLLLGAVNYDIRSTPDTAIASRLPEVGGLDPLEATTAEDEAYAQTS